MRRIVPVHGRLSHLPERFELSGVEILGRKQCQAFMRPTAVGREELAAPLSGVVIVSEATGVARPVLGGLELAFAERIVVAHARSREASFYAQVREQIAEAVRDHRRATVLMDDQLIRLDRPARQDLAEQVTSQAGVLLARDHPADGIAAEQVQDDVQAQVEAADDHRQLRDVPSVDLVGAGRFQLRLDVVLCRALGAAFARFFSPAEQAIHGRD